MFRKNHFVKIVFTAAAAVLLSGCPQAPPGRGGERSTMPDLKREIYIINGLAETVSIINPDAVVNPGGDITPDQYIDNGNTVDLTKREIYNDMLLVGKSPNHILYYDDKLYITSSGENIVEVYDESTFAWVGEIDLGAGTNPWMVVRAGDTNKGYVPGFAAGDVAVVNLDTYGVSARVPAGAGPEGAAYINGKVFVSNAAWSQESAGFGMGTVTVIDTATDTAEATVDIGEGTNPQSVIAFPGLNEVHVICTGKNGGDDSDDGEIVIIDADPANQDYKTIKQRLFIGGSPTGGAGGVDTGRNRVYLSGVGGLQSYDYGDGTAGSAAVIHDSSDYIIVGDDPGQDFYSGVVYDPQTDVIFVTLFTYDTIIALDGETYDRLGEITGSDGVQFPVLSAED